MKNCDQSVEINYLSTEEQKQELKKIKNPKAFIDYSQPTDNVYGNPTKKRRVLIVFDDIIGDMEPNEKLSSTDCMLLSCHVRVSK